MHKLCWLCQLPFLPLKTFLQSLPSVPPFHCLGPAAPLTSLHACVVPDRRFCFAKCRLFTASINEAITADLFQNNLSQKNQLGKMLL